MPDRLVSFGNFSPDFVAALAARLRPRRVLEIFAGNGLLAGLLRDAGVAVTATSLFASHDGHEEGLRSPVREMDAVAAVLQLGSEHDVLLMSWPTTTEAAARAAQLWGAEKPIFYIGEMPLPEWGLGGLPGCASDAFFELTEVVGPLPGYEPRNMLDKAVELRLRGPVART